ncbi:Aste57867_12308 [Aphanomyces stellatus]|uniref:Aste57867_12308 protein n=1 Tax=Aphanomyces stellatus TaxID=120398 RepID=A0A485KV92_9STRA|nr:hypothetical protein As57867_012262 [Aphanomyces stellatus]VFT89160.1 Aste57867_12308 [Aphanomyces stellatus]
MKRLTVAVAAVATAALECPYTSVPFGNITIADKAFCPAAALDGTCVVDKTCAVVDSKNKEIIGNFGDLNASVTVLSFKTESTRQASCNLTLATLPNFITEIRFEGFVNVIVPANFKWPASLVTLGFKYAGTQRYAPAIPATVTDLSLNADSIDQPRIVPSSIKHLALDTTASIGEMDATSVTSLSIGRGSRITNLKLTKKLVSLRFESSVIERWIMDGDTYDALNQLTPRGNFTNGVMPTVDGHPQGVYYDVAYLIPLSISTSQAECDASQGQLKQLWQYRQLFSQVYGKGGSNNVVVEKNIPFLVCVTSANNNNSTSLPIVDNSTGLGTGATVGIAVGAIALVSLVAFLVMRSRQKQSREDTYQSATPTTTAATYLNDDDSQLKMQMLEMLRLDGRALQLVRVVGAGAFANVWLGTYYGQHVAVKTLHSNKVTLLQVQAFIQEIALMGSFESPYIVRLIGAVWTRPSDVQGVMELMTGGDLKDHLTAHTPEAFPWSDKYLHIHSIVEGLVYLHSLDIIHRDLKSRNVLLDAEKGTKLTDFGVSKEDMQATMTVGVGTFRWMAPEVIQDMQYTVAADIYSLGCLLSEFSTHHIPYEDLKNPVNGQPMADSAIMVKVVSGTLQPSFRQDCPGWLRELALRCLANEPDERPTAAQVAYSMQSKLKELASSLYAL